MDHLNENEDYLRIEVFYGSVLSPTFYQPLSTEDIFLEDKIMNNSKKSKYDDFMHGLTESIDKDIVKESISYEIKCAFKEGFESGFRSGFSIANE